MVSTRGRSALRVIGWGFCAIHRWQNHNCGSIMKYMRLQGGYGYQHGNLLLFSNREFTIYSKGFARVAAGGGASVYS